MCDIDGRDQLEEQFVAELMNKVIELVETRYPDCRVLVDCGDGSGLDFRFGGVFPLDGPDRKVVLAFDLS